MGNSTDAMSIFDMVYGHSPFIKRERTLVCIYRAEQHETNERDAFKYNNVLPYTSEVIKTFDQYLYLAFVSGQASTSNLSFYKS